MTNLPRLTVTQEQADEVADLLVRADEVQLVRFRLPERPTMPCPDCGGLSVVVGGKYICYWCRNGTVPIPEGTRVEVGFIKDWNISEPRWQRRWHPVATATLGEVRKALLLDGRIGWAVTLTDIEEVGESWGDPKIRPAGATPAS